MKPLVSIVIPCFRQAHYLPMAVESAFSQSYPAVQTIVVNDGSDDETDSIARGYGDRIIYVSRQNGGLAVARNSGFSVAEGKYVVFLDADDLLCPDALLHAVGAMEGKDDRMCMIGFRVFRNNDVEDVECEIVPGSKTDIARDRSITEESRPTTLVHLFRGNGARSWRI